MSDYEPLPFDVLEPQEERLYSYQEYLDTFAPNDLEEIEICSCGQSPSENMPSPMRLPIFTTWPPHNPLFLLTTHT